MLPAPAGAPGGETRALALNNAGQVFGVAGVLVISYVPVVWTNGVAAILPAPSGHHVVTGFGSGFGWDFINDRGTVVSVARDDAILQVNSGYRTVIWQNGVPHILAELPPQTNPTPQEYANGVFGVPNANVANLNIVPIGLNAHNRVLVYTCGAYWIWNIESESYERLVVKQGPYENPTASLVGNHLNDLGHVVLDRRTEAPPSSIYAWYQSQIYFASGGYADLPSKGPNLGSTYINNDNQVLAFYNEGGPDHLMLWDGAQTVDLGPGGAAALNDLGDVVFSSGFPRTSFIHTNGVSNPLNIPAPLSGPFFFNNAGRIAENTSLNGSQQSAVLFTPRHQLTINASPLDGGTITANPSSTDGFYSAGTSVQLTPTPAPGYVFANWSGDLAGSTNPESILMTGARSVTANFLPVSTITVSSNPPGLGFTVDGTTYTASQTFNWVVGSTHTLATTSPQAGSAGTRFVFTNWSDAGGLSHEIAVPGSATSFTANFATQHSLSTALAPTGAGAVTATPASADTFYDAGTVVQLLASPNTGFVFSNWVGDLTGTVNPQSLTMSAPRSVAANFSAVSVELQSLTLAPTGPSIFVGSSLQFTATGRYSDGSTRDLTSTVVWSSSKTSVATITSPGGLATGMAKGNATIRALAGTLSASTVLAVKAVALQSIAVTPASAAIPVGGTQQFRAVGSYDDGSTRDLTNTVSWSSAPKSAASVSSTGLVTGVKPGTATITAKSGSNSGSATLTVN